jgi:hypothetical protein
MQDKGLNNIPNQSNTHEETKSRLLQDACYSEYFAFQFSLTE